MIEPESSAAAPSGTPAARQRILVAEDNAMNQKLFRTILSSEGVDVDLVENGQEAVEAVRSNGSYDAVLMDVQMPVMDGLEAARRIRDDVGDHRVPIIAVTAFLAQVGRENCMRSGMNDYIEKPFQRETILGVLRKWVAFE